MPDARRLVDVDAAVEAEIARSLAAGGRPIAPIGSGDRLIENLGLTSFALAEIVARLNAALAADPFRGSLAFTDVRTVGDLCRAYRGQPARTALPDELEASERRALARRAGRRR